MITNIATTFLSAIRILTYSVLIQIEAAAFIQGQCLLSSASITSGHYSTRAVTEVSKKEIIMI